LFSLIKIAVISRRGVPYFNPFLRKPYVFAGDLNFKTFLHAKLINAEYATLKSNAFSAFSKKTVNSSLEKVCEKLEFITKKFVLKPGKLENFIFWLL
jgi:hypothetical protein